MHARFLALVATTLPLGGCATFGTHVAGRFACSAPHGTCAPTAVIDAQATAMSGGTAPGATSVIMPNPVEAARRAAIGGDPARTRERLLRIVFPAHVDPQGTLHEEAIVYAVAENAAWAVTRRGAAKFRTSAAEVLPTTGALDAGAMGPVPDAANADAACADESPWAGSSLAARAGFPCSPRAAISGAHSPAIEGFDAVPRASAPRSFAAEDLPGTTAIDAAHARAKAPAKPVAGPPASGPSATRPPVTGHDGIRASSPKDPR